MKILHIVKKDLTPTEKAVIEAHRAAHEVVVVDLRTDADYGRIVGRIAAADKVISW